MPIYLGRNRYYALLANNTQAEFIWSFLWKLIKSGFVWEQDGEISSKRKNRDVHLLRSLYAKRNAVSIWYKAMYIISLSFHLSGMM